MTAARREPFGSRTAVLASGGVESCALLCACLVRCDEVTPVYVRSGLRWEKAELFWLAKLLRRARSPRLKPLKVLDLPMRDLYAKHWSITGRKVPGAASPDQAVYLPGRNIALLSKAAIFAAGKNIPFIEIGVLKGNPFSDSSPSFLSKFSRVLSEGLGKPIAIRAPLQKLKKEEVIRAWKKLPFELTFSCIRPKGLEHCGACNKCAERKRAFLAAGLKF
ncbi:MAG: 7-cyano-7-deazaguanine synthase [Candidatus Omnitrophota bacterium]